ncbi:aldehyde oxidase GLOX-like [Andrographis paniculata]|uniref:aldehyde oxidase GLOX-like n=1 Tax=Andrographis paniculata TaxID=175694 RepID=UPI0021E91C5A|nr:aldehyde oxidase GLOX-like [Andrographis paniculata]
MASMIWCSLLFLIVVLSLVGPSSSRAYNRHRHYHHHHRRHQEFTLLPPGTFSSAASPARFEPFVSPSIFDYDAFPPHYTADEHATGSISSGGQWMLLQDSIGVSAMHMQLLYNNKVVIFDRTDFGPSKLTLPAGKCRFNDDALPVDCTGHSLLYDVVSNSYRPLMVQTDVWCSSGSLDPQGTLIQTGGYHAGDRKIRLFSPCDLEECDWTELDQNLTVQRWYASDHVLPDGRVIIVGGRRAFSYEFFPKTGAFNDTVFYFPFLRETTDPIEENNLYPFLYLLPDGNIFIFANQRSAVLDYKNDRILREFPPIPCDKRSYPATGSSVMLPLKLIAGVGYAFPEVEVMICGGAKGGAYVKALRGLYEPASRSCGRIRVTGANPRWEMEEMPMGRVMPDMLLLPTGDVIILNGAARGTAGWECAADPVLNPVLYRPGEREPGGGGRFSLLNPSSIARMYHSSAILLPDGRVLVGGSNPHTMYNFTGVEYPTELSLEAFSPPYLASDLANLRPSVLTMEGPAGGHEVSYGQQFAITFSLGLHMQPRPWGEFTVTMAAPSFTTHSFAMNQRLLVLYVLDQHQLSTFAYKVTVYAPPNPNIAPPGYYMLFVVHHGVPSHGVWIRIK